MVLQTKFLLLLTFFITTSVQARFLVEPGYHLYQGSFEAGSESGELTGEVFGLNLAYLAEFFMVGLSLEKGQYTYDKNITANNYAHFSGGGVGTFIGFHFMDNIKIWTGYLNSTLEPTANKSIRYFGQHASFGLGYRVYEGLMFNVQGFRNQFTQMEDDNTGKTSGLDTNIKTQGHSYYFSYILIF
ncbi:MAG: hypothetical protein HON90_10720 [Halobacteriovoraceae bacterium]|jgi:hypothetical protein|nr:hypothetical protein [Halobacteriovoraceae bacterium]